MNVKRFLMCILLFTSLTACANSASDKGGCSMQGELCIQVRAKEPVHFDEPVTIMITVTSEKDIAGLVVSLTTWPKSIVVQDAFKAEPGKVSWKDQGKIDWRVDIKANQTVTFTRSLTLPPPTIDLAHYDIFVRASTPQLSADDSLVIYLNREDKQVYLSGTSIPITPGSLPTMDPVHLATLYAMPTATSWPTWTPPPPTVTPSPSTTPYPAPEESSSLSYPPPAMPYP